MTNSRFAYHEFQEKVAIVSGGASGIGKTIAGELAKQGCSVIAFDWDLAKCDAASAMFKKDKLPVEMLQGDVSSQSDTQRIIAHTVENYGKINYLVNCAGIRYSGTILDTEEAVWDKQMEVNLKGMFLLTKAALPVMISQGGGAIVNIGSNSGFAGKNHFAYTVAKGGVLPFTRSLALDYAQQKIRINAIIPGYIESAMTENRSEELKKQVAQSSVAGRIGLPKDVANIALFFLSDLTENVSGTSIEVATQPGRVPID